MRPESIALVHYAAPPVVGGVEAILAKHAQLMRRAGHSVRVIAGRGATWDESIPLRLLPLLDSRHPRVLAVKEQLDGGRVPGDFDDLTVEIGVELQEVLKDADVVIAHNVCSLHKNLALTAALKSLHEAVPSPRLILWHHDLAWATPRYLPELHPGYPWDLLRSDWGAVHVVVSETRRAELAHLLNVDKESIIVVPNGIDLATFFKLEPLTKSLIDRMALTDSEPLLLLPVRITRRKNIELALRVLHCLRKTSPGVKLVVTGPPGPHSPSNLEYFSTLKRLRDELGLASTAYFLADLTDDYLPDAVIADFYRLADGIILPSLEEGFGIPLLEAALCHVPVFCSDIPPLRELGGEDVTYFAPEAEPESVAEAIVRRLLDEAGGRFAARVRRTYDWGHIYKQCIAPLLESL